MGNDLHRGIDLGHASLSHFDLQNAQINLSTQDLPVQVVIEKHVAVHDDQPAHPHASQRLDHVSPQASQAHHRYRRTQQPDLPFPAHCAEAAQITPWQHPGLQGC